MSSSVDSPLDSLRRNAESLLANAHAPFSGQPTAAALLLQDGRWVPGVRVESASFSLTLPALLNAYTTAVTAGHGGTVVAAALTRALHRDEKAYLESLRDDPLSPAAPDVWTRTPAGALPTPGARIDAHVDAVSLPPEPEMPTPPIAGATSDGHASAQQPTKAADDEAHAGRRGIILARRAAQRALVPASDFKVGAVIETPDGTLFPGANVENEDWARILCAERNAAGTARSYGYSNASTIFLTCIDDPSGTPCGACRQVLAELTPEAALWMDRHGEEPEVTRPGDLLPGFFKGQAILRA